jgi:hypothetical protein
MAVGHPFGLRVPARGGELLNRPDLLFLHSDDLVNQPVRGCQSVGSSEERQPTGSVWGAGVCQLLDALGVVSERRRVFHSVRDVEQPAP